MSHKIEALNHLLADSYALYLQTQNYHWNVTGPYFASLHILFEEQYTELAEAVDEIAERIRALGSTAPGSFSAFASLSKVQGDVEVNDSQEMLKALIASHEQVLVSAKAVLEISESDGDDVTVDVATGRLTVHEKVKWMLQSSL